MMTISRYITEQQRKTDGSGEFTQLLNSLVAAIKAISSAVRVAGLNNLMGLAGTGNATGDDQVNFYLFFFGNYFYRGVVVRHHIRLDVRKLQNKFYCFLASL